eukprot:6208071-Pleurochrysis_carterae.AAC.2
MRVLPNFRRERQRVPQAHIVDLFVPGLGGKTDPVGPSPLIIHREQARTLALSLHTYPLSLPFFLSRACVGLRLPPTFYFASRYRGVWRFALGLLGRAPALCTCARA